MTTDRVWRFLTSIRLTVVLLAFSVLLVFVGTIAQADEGLYVAQERYFKHWIVWGISFFGHQVPVPLPGGYLLGTLLLANLLATHVKRLEWSWRKLGIHLTHAGVILLLIGQLTSDLFSRETQMRFVEGQTLHHSESPMNFELVFITGAEDGTDEVVAIPAPLLAHGGELRAGNLPFVVRVKTYWPNSDLAFRAPMQSNAPPLASNGLARSFDFTPVPETHKSEERNVPTAVLELVSPKGSLGTWVATGWNSDETLMTNVRASFTRQAGPDTADRIIGHLVEPQTVQVNGRTWSFALRPVRVYNPFSLTLLKTTHKVYPGTDIPKDFRSRVRIENPRTGEHREVDIFMNNPLRYGGLTFYQYQMGRDELDASRGTSTLQVVRNPSWLAPYAGCIIVGVGLCVQFMFHLVGFVSRKKTA